MARIDPTYLKFCTAYVETGDVVAAAKAIDYSVNMGNELLDMAEIQECIWKLKVEAVLTSSEANPEETVRFFRAVMLNETYGIKDRLKAGELVARHLGLFNDSLTVKKEALSDEAVAEWINQTAALRKAKNPRIFEDVAVKELKS